MENKLREEVKRILSELIGSASNSECPFLIGNEGDVDDWYEKGVKNMNLKLFKEGLIKTYPFDFAIQRLGEYGSVKLISNKIYLGLKSKYFDRLSGLIKYFDTLGYFVATFKVLKKGLEINPGNYINVSDLESALGASEDAQQIWLEIEAKFDELGDAPEFLYHLTLNVNLDKIKKQGLVPRSKSKKSYHPDRVYVVDDIKSLRQILVQFSEIENKVVSNYSVLKIDYSLAGKPKLYNDPNFLSFGYYSTENIPPKAIVSIINGENII